MPLLFYSKCDLCCWAVSVNRLASFSQLLDVTPVTPEIVAFLEAAKARLVQCEDVAVQYLANLNTTMDHHKHGIEMGKVYNQKATELTFSADDLEEEIEQPLLYQSVAEVEESIELLNTKLRTVCIPACVPLWCSCVIPMWLWSPAEHEQPDDPVQRDQRPGGVVCGCRQPGGVQPVHHPGAVRTPRGCCGEARRSPGSPAGGGPIGMLSVPPLSISVVYQQSLSVEQTKEQLRRQFADKAAAFKAHCDARSNQITALDGDLEGRIIAIQKLHEEYCGEV